MIVVLLIQIHLKLYWFSGFNNSFQPKKDDKLQIDQNMMKTTKNIPEIS